VSHELGNTPAVARGSYVDPRVVAGYEQGITIDAAVRRADRVRRAGVAQAILEKATRTLIRRVANGAKGSAAATLARTA
jgi:DNA topoisomerase IB